MPLKGIFEAQSKLMHKYHPIEEANGALETNLVPVNIQSREGQARLRRFAWFILEELAETLDAKYHQPENLPGELSDILHFMTEWAILSGITPDEIYLPKGPPLERTLNTDYAPSALEVVYRVGMAINLLKGKPWKQSYRPTDEYEYKLRVTQAYESLLKLILHSGIGLDRLSSLYFNKNEINHQRIAGGY